MVVVVDVNMIKLDQYENVELLQLIDMVIWNVIRIKHRIYEHLIDWRVSLE
jgi:hypothetical protein